MAIRSRFGQPRTIRTRAAASNNGVLHPLDFAYTLAGVAPPQVKQVSPEDIPLPYRALLVHERSMTLTLEQHFGGRVVLRPLAVFASRAWCLRRVLLVQEYSGRPVEMGAIRMKLDAFRLRIRGAILRNEVPLGRILSDEGVDHQSRPRAFVAVTPNPEMMGLFWMREPRTLYGRRTEVFLRGTKIGDIVEVLPLVRRCDHPERISLRLVLHTPTGDGPRERSTPSTGVEPSRCYCAT
jgi:hypothetical protein